MSLLFKKVLEKIKDFETKISNLESSKVNKTQLFSGDLNNLKTTGFYYINTNTTNIPTAGYTHYLTVNAYGNYILQQATRVTPANSNLKLYQRQCYENTWTSWQEV